MNYRKRVLIIDDDSQVRRLLKDIFNDYECHAVATVDEAIELINQSACDVVISDIRMPGKTGINLLEASKAIFPGLPVIMITGHGDKLNAIESVKGGAFDYLEKPFSDDEILHAVDRALDKRNVDLEKEALTLELKEKNVELETLNEELQASNEELETGNEEYQSANEELHATEEELRETQEKSDAKISELENRLSKVEEQLKKLGKK